MAAWLPSKPHRSASVPCQCWDCRHLLLHLFCFLIFLWGPTQVLMLMWQAVYCLSHHTILNSGGGEILYPLWFALVTHTHTYKHTHTQIYTYAYTHIYTNIQTYTYTFIHTHMCTPTHPPTHYQKCETLLALRNSYGFKKEIYSGGLEKTQLQSIWLSHLNCVWFLGSVYCSGCAELTKFNQSG